MTPDWTGSFASLLTWKGFSLNALIDVNYGGSFLSATSSYADFYGNSERAGQRDNASADFPTGHVIVDGVNENGKKNTTKIGLEEYYQGLGGSYDYEIGRAHV